MGIEKGNGSAMTNLGYMYRHGLGVEQDHSKAIHYYEMAIEKGDGPTMTDLGYMYHHGEGVEQDHTKAIHYYEMAIERGNGLAMTNLKKLLAERVKDNSFIKETIAFKRKYSVLEEENKTLREEVEILNLLPDAPGYHKAKKRFYVSSTEPLSKAASKK